MTLLLHYWLPTLVGEVPATSLFFHISLHVYGLILVCMATIFACCVTRFGAAK